MLEGFPKGKRVAQGLKSLNKPKSRQENNIPAPNLTQEQVHGLILLYQQRRLQEALELGTSLAGRYPNVPMILNILGAVNADMGMTKKAIALYTKALRLKPDYAEAHNNLGNALTSLGKTEEAIASYAKALKIKPAYAEALSNLGGALVDAGRLDEAIECSTKALQINPNSAEAHNNLGNALKGIGRPGEAISSYSQAVRIRPNYFEAHSNLGTALFDLGRSDEAIACYTTALQIKPDYAEAHNNLGITLNEDGKYDQAIASFGKALQIKPDYMKAHCNLGNAYSNLGKSEQAAVCYTKALRLKPDYAEVQRSLGLLEKYTVGDRRISRMLAQISSPAISENDKMHISFALGKAYEDVGDTENSFKHYLEGNRLRKMDLGYDINLDRRLFSLIKSLFDGANLPNPDDIQPVARNERRPIFIVGMPRSGTTLTEQILASHSQVYGAGELSALNRIVMPVLNGIQNVGTGNLAAPTFVEIRRRYLAEVAGLGDQVTNFTDKMPSNFLFIGFILTAFPEAKVTNLNRNPVAVCWSIFRQFFSSRGNGYAYDLVDVAEYYKLYQNLMDFWRERFPSQIYDLNYESLTENQREETRNLLEYCDLGWEDQCISFHMTERSVKTASKLQVKQEMYTGSSAEWRKYEPFIQPMIQALTVRSQ